MSTIVMKKANQVRLLRPADNQVEYVRDGQLTKVTLKDGWQHLEALLRCGWAVSHSL